MALSRFFIYADYECGRITVDQARIRLSLLCHKCDTFWSCAVCECCGLHCPCDNNTQERSQIYRHYLWRIANENKLPSNRAGPGSRSAK